MPTPEEDIFSLNEMSDLPEWICIGNPIPYPLDVNDEETHV